MIKRITILLALAGLAAAIWVTATNKKELPSPPPSQPPAVNPFPNGLAALGFVEARSREVETGVPEPGLVLEVLARPNEQVKAGQPLFRMDTRLLEADLVTARAGLAAAEAELARLEAMPRPEDVGPLEARVAEARAWADDAQRRLDRTIVAQQVNAAAVEEVDQRRAALAAAQAVLATAEAELSRVRAGAWEPELAVARAEVARNTANVESVQRRIDRLTVRSPIDGVILRRNIEPGEFAEAGVGAEAPFVIADLSVLHVRAQVDEEDTPLLREGARAVAQVRGPIPDRVDLTMLWIEPLARPKSQITGQTGELIDTRVVDVVFEVRPRDGGPRLYPGMAVDVFIEAAGGN